MSIADTYRAMSDDIGRAANDVDDEGVRTAYIALAELWPQASHRADGFPISVGEPMIANSQKAADTAA